MGILDDAIREHLELKRRLGAEDDELARLEDEAFGPPSRPGDPDFPSEASETAEGAPAGETATAAPEAPAGAAVVGTEPPTSEEPSVTTSEEPELATAQPESPTAEPESATSEPAATGFYDHESDDATATADPTPTPTREERAEAIESDAVEVEAEVVEAEPEVAAVEPEPAAQPLEPPIESLDTVEHHFEGALEDTGDVEVVEGEIADEEGAEAPAEDGDEEDVLEETPEFLRDQPEDDELWFEQGEPKDFDF